MRRRSPSEASTARRSSDSRCCWAACKPVEQAPDDRRHEHEEQQEAAREHPGEAAPQVEGPSLHRCVVAVDLEEQLGSRGGPDRAIDLEQLAAVALELVLGAVEVRDLGTGLRVRERVALLGPEREALSDEAGLVGVDDGAVGLPQLDPHDPVGQHALAHRAVKPVVCRLVADEQRVRQRRLDDRQGEQVGRVGRVVHRLALGQAAGRERRAHDDHGKDGQGGEAELHEGPPSASAAAGPGARPRRRRASTTGEGRGGPARRRLPTQAGAG